MIDTGELIFDVPTGDDACGIDAAECGPISFEMELLSGGNYFPLPDFMSAEESKLSWYTTDWDDLGLYEIRIKYYFGPDAVNEVEGAVDGGSIGFELIQES